VPIGKLGVAGSRYFTGQMTCLLPNQQCKSTDERSLVPKEGSAVEKVSQCLRYFWRCNFVLSTLWSHQCIPFYQTNF